LPAKKLKPYVEVSVKIEYTRILISVNTATFRYYFVAKQLLNELLLRDTISHDPDVLVATTSNFAEKLEPCLRKPYNGRNCLIPNLAQVSVSDTYQYFC